MSDGRRLPGGALAAGVVRVVALLARAVLGTPARAARGTARRVVDPARQVAAYFVSERVTLRQGFVAVIIAGLTSLLAGLVLAGMENRIVDVRGLFVLIPVSIGMRGAIFGALSARLGTQIHSGLFEVSQDRSSLLMQNVYAATLLTVATSATMGILARAIAALLDITTVSVWDFVAIALVGGVLSSAVVLAVTVVLSIQSYRRDWDLDSVGAPIITAIGDVVTLPFLLLATFAIEIENLTLIVGVLGVVAGIVALVQGWRTRREITQRIVRESFPVLCLAIVLNVLAGTVVEPRVGDVFQPLPALLIIVPGFLENTGALGSILAARLGSKLHLGAVTPSAKPEPVAFLDGAVVLVLGITVFGLIAVLALGLAEVVGVARPGALQFVGATMIGGLLATVLAGIIGYYAAITTFRFGLDPDNHTIPVVTSGMDLVGVICLLIALSVVGIT